MIPLVDPGLVVPDWGRGPDAPDLGLISTVATDARGDVYVSEVITPNRLQKFSRR
jgi:hypothetical protein